MGEWLGCSVEWERMNSLGMLGVYALTRNHCSHQPCKREERPTSQIWKVRKESLNFQAWGHQVIKQPLVKEHREQSFLTLLLLSVTLTQPYRFSPLPRPGTMEVFNLLCGSSRTLLRLSFSWLHLSNEGYMAEDPGNQGQIWSECKLSAWYKTIVFLSH